MRCGIKMQKPLAEFREHAKQNITNLVKKEMVSVED